MPWGIISVPHGINFLSIDFNPFYLLGEVLPSPGGYDDMVGTGFTDLRSKLFGGLYHPLVLGLRHPYPRKMHNLFYK